MLKGTEQVTTSPGATPDAVVGSAEDSVWAEPGTGGSLSRSAAEITIIIEKTDDIEKVGPPAAPSVDSGAPELEWPQLLCPDHLAQAETGWWPFCSEQVDDIALVCTACRDVMLSYLNPDPSGYIEMVLRRQPGWSPEQRWDLWTVHEAGHAVVGHVSGLALDYVTMYPSGHCRWVPGAYRLDLWLAMSWAGGEAGRRWISDNDAGKPGLFIDHASECFSDHRSIDELTSRNRVKRDTGHVQSRHLLDKHWDAVIAVAGYMKRHGTATASTLESLTGQTRPLTPPTEPALTPLLTSEDWSGSIDTT